MKILARLTLTPLIIRGGAASRHGIPLALLLGVMSISFSACGDNEEKRARSVAELFVSGQRAACQAMTDTFLEAFGGSLKTCHKAIAELREGKKVKLETVDIEGDEATVLVRSGTDKATLTLMKRDGEWKLARIGNPDESSDKAGESVDERTDEESPQIPAPKVRRGLSPRETVDVYYDAIGAGDAPSLCGVLTQRYARRQILGGGKQSNPISSCVERLMDYDWSKTRREAKGVKLTKEIQAGNTAIVVLSSGKKVRLRRRPGRWVIDDLIP